MTKVRSCGPTVVDQADVAVAAPELFSALEDKEHAMQTEMRRHRALSHRAPNRPGLLLLVMIVLMTSLAAIRPTAFAAESPRVQPVLMGRGAANPDQVYRVIVQRATNDAQAEKYVTRTKGATKVKDVAAAGFVALVRGRDLSDIGRHPAVKYVSIDAEMVNMVTPTTVSESNLGTNYAKTVNAPSLWASAITGANVGVAVLDTGMSATSDFADGSGGSRVVTQAKFSSGTNNMSDGYGHGTHVAGIIGGNSWTRSTTTLQGKYIGIAPQSNLINVKVSDDIGKSYISDVVNAIDWVVTNRQTYNIRVMNLSMVSSLAESYTTSILCAAVERAWFNGIAVVVAAGNGGPNTTNFPPANDPFVITVGAADQLNTVTVGDDQIAPWSSFGTTQDGFSKPEIAAPGRYITSVSASSGTTLAKAFPSRIVDSNYIWMSGTSMAAPVVAGIAALAFQAHPEWTNDQVKWLLTQTARSIGVTDPATGSFVPHVGQGAGVVDAYATVRYAGVPAHANQGLTISSQLVSSDGTTTYSSSSWSSSSWSTSSWSSSSWSSSSWSSSSWSSSSWSTSSWSSACGDIACE